MPHSHRSERRRRRSRRASSITASLGPPVSRDQVAPVAADHQQRAGPGPAPANPAHGGGGDRSRRRPAPRPLARTARDAPQHAGPSTRTSGQLPRWRQAVWSARVAWCGLLPGRDRHGVLDRMASSRCASRSAAQLADRAPSAPRGIAAPSRRRQVQRLARTAAPRPGIQPRQVHPSARTRPRGRGAIATVAAGPLRQRVRRGACAGVHRQWANCLAEESLDPSAQDGGRHLFAKG